MNIRRKFDSGKNTLRNRLDRAFRCGKVDPEWFDSLDEATEDEEDMLDLAFGLTETSRLGCQIIVTDELDGITVTLPSETRNMLG